MAKIPQEIRELCEGPHLGFIATDGPEGVNVTPKGSLAYMDEEHLMFAERASNKTRKNIEQNNQVAVFMINRDLSKGYQFKGTAELVDQGTTLDKVNADPRLKERKMPPATLAVRIKVDKIYDMGKQIV